MHKLPPYLPCGHLALTLLTPRHLSVTWLSDSYLTQMWRSSGFEEGVQMARCTDDLWGGRDGDMPDGQLHLEPSVNISVCMCVCVEVAPGVNNAYCLQGMCRVL
jgi:hypothetical protein